LAVLLPDRIYFQEIKLTNNQGSPSKAKIQDMVATRHPSSSSTQADEKEDEVNSNPNESNSAKKRESFRIACGQQLENNIQNFDGSQKIYVADSEKN
jgi:hypothetical protein